MVVLFTRGVIQEIYYWRLASPGVQGHGFLPVDVNGEILQNAGDQVEDGVEFCRGIVPLAGAAAFASQHPTIAVHDLPAVFRVLIAEPEEVGVLLEVGNGLD